MKVQDVISQTDKYYITVEGDVVCHNDNISNSINFSIDQQIGKSIAMTKSVVYDIVMLKSTQFVEKYKDLLKPNAPLSCSGLYRKMREFIVDNEVPINDKSRVRKPKLVTQAIGDPGESRQAQVEKLINSGITSPKEISDSLTMNISYVRTVLKKIKDAKLKQQDAGDK